MNPRHLALPIAAALALALGACGQDADRTSGSTFGSDPTRTAQGPDTTIPNPGERPGAPGNPSGMSDTSPTIPNTGENRPEKKDEPFGQGSPQTAMKSGDVPAVASPPQGRGY